MFFVGIAALWQGRQKLQWCKQEMTGDLERGGTITGENNSSDLAAAVDHGGDRVDGREVGEEHDCNGDDWLDGIWTSTRAGTGETLVSNDEGDNGKSEK
ncbi:hypothetical protein ACLMJK_000554 [Lecanora helva]